jgi:hypothetical protein
VKFHEGFISRWKNFEFQSIHGKKVTTIVQNWEKTPISVVKFMGKLRNLAMW